MLLLLYLLKMFSSQRREVTNCNTVHFTGRARSVRAWSVDQALVVQRCDVVENVLLIGARYLNPSRRGGFLGLDREKYAVNQIRITGHAMSFRADSMPNRRTHRTMARSP